MPTAAKIHSEEIAEKVSSKEQELQFIEVNTVVSVLKYISWQVEVRDVK